MVEKIALRNALNGVQNSESPCLIIVCNKQGDADTDTPIEKQIESSTKSFFEVNEVLKDIYSEVFVIVLPNVSSKYKETEEQFNTLIEKGLKKKILQCIEVSRRRREQRGILFNESVWIKLFNEMIQRMNSRVPIQMGTLFTIAMLPNREEKYALYLSSLFILPFEDSYQFILKYLAALLAKSMYKNFVETVGKLNTKENISKFYSQNLMNLKNKEVLSSFNSILKELDLLKPCQCVQNKIPCTLTKKLHGDKHINPDVNSFWSIRGFVHGVLSWFVSEKKNIQKAPSVWKGSFQFNEKEFEKDINPKEIFESTYLELIGNQENPIQIDSIICLQADIIQTLYHNSKELVQKDQKNTSLIISSEMFIL